MNVDFALRAVGKILNILDLSFDSKVISVILNFCCNLHTTGNHCAKYEHPESKHKRGVRVTSHNSDNFEVYWTLIFDSKVTSMIRSETFVIVYDQ